jgi:hypothetical protein
MPYLPLGMAQQLEIEDHVMGSYHAQLWLRKRLNEIHSTLYNPNFPLSHEHGNVIGAIEAMLDNMTWVPEGFEFSHNDPPAGDILSARLRAKYWGARVITYRPFVRQILQFNFARAHPGGLPMPPSGLRADISVPSIGPDAQSIEDIPQDVINHAMKGVHALIESTRAFHGLKEKRYIVTNIFGTAHAYVLYASQQKKRLRVMS